MYVFHHKASLVGQKEPGTAASAGSQNVLMCHYGTRTTGSSPLTQDLHLEENKVSLC